jgi:dihydrofolate synthase/folylpolyglutamate synthase
MRASAAYDQTLDWLYALEANRGMDFRLERIRRVSAELGDPQRAFPAIHVGGTNGKGSTAAMLHAMYASAGRRVGLYTSPHLLSFCERIRVGQNAIEEEAVVESATRVRAAGEATGVDLTFFEIATLMAFLEFERAEVDLAVVEVGLGGRLDATNVVESAAAVITSVSLEHREYLGDTIEAIALEKAGILKPGALAVTGRLDGTAFAVVAARARDLDVPLLRYGGDFDEEVLRDSDGAALAIGLAGPHQRHNAAVAVATARALRPRFAVSDRAISTGLRDVRWPGRLERLSTRPLTLVDAAHNPGAAIVLRTALEAAGLEHPRILVFGVMSDKEWKRMLAELVPFFDHVVLVPVANRRGLDPNTAKVVVADLRSTEVAASAEEGVRIARERAGDAGAVVVTGSIFLVSEVYAECGGEEDPFASSDPE